MIAMVSRPYFAPYAGFFRMACQADVLVLLDEVQLPHGGSWVTRNRFKNHLGELRLSIPVARKGCSHQKIREVQIVSSGAWRRKHLTSLMQAYRHAPYLADHQGLLEEIFSPRQARIAELDRLVIEYVLARLQARVRLVQQSELGVSAPGAQLPLAIAARLGAQTLLAHPGARPELDQELARRHGIELCFTSPPSPVYPQLWGPFIANLSALDLLFNCGPRAGDIIAAGGGWH